MKEKPLRDLKGRFITKKPANHSSALGGLADKHARVEENALISKLKKEAVLGVQSSGDSSDAGRLSAILADSISTNEHRPGEKVKNLERRLNYRKSLNKEGVSKCTKQSCTSEQTSWKFWKVGGLVAYLKNLLRK